MLIIMFEKEGIMVLHTSLVINAIDANFLCYLHYLSLTCAFDPLFLKFVYERIK